MSEWDAVDLELTCEACSKRVMEGVIAGDFFYCSTYCMATDNRLTPLQALTARHTVDELNREKWQHRKGDQYAPVFGDFTSLGDGGFEWSRLGPHEFCQTVDTAIRRGLAAQESDDFCIAVVRDHAVVALLWMDEDKDEEPQVLMDVAEVLGL